MQNAAGNRLVEATRKAEGDRVRTTDKSDRATTELARGYACCCCCSHAARQVLDPRTRMILFKMLTRGFITEIDGCISTGKEANVYHALLDDGARRTTIVPSQRRQAAASPSRCSRRRSWYSRTATAM